MDKNILYYLSLSLSILLSLLILFKNLCVLCASVAKYLHQIEATAASSNSIASPFGII